MAKSHRKRRKKATRAGKLRIADHWNAISIIANSQSNPLKAVAEFVENSIDARAGHIVITRGKRKGEFYLKVSDDGEGIPKDEQGMPDFRHVDNNSAEFPGSSVFQNMHLARTLR